jgi:HAD superfamily hydrolase (TIGR01458 family)
MKPNGILLDLDGTLYVGESLIPGAREAIELLRERAIPFLFATNTTRLSRRSLHDRMSRLGLEADPDQIHTGLMAARSWLLSRGRKRILPLLPDTAWEDLEGLELVTDRADAILVGDLGPAWTFERLNRAFRLLMDGAALVTINRNRYWQTEDGLTLDAGPFVTALEYAASTSATVIGKPSLAFYEAAASKLGLPAAEISMIGDDIEGDVEGAQKAGLRGVLVRTGKFREQDLAGTIRPDAVLDSIAEISQLIL